MDGCGAVHRAQHKIPRRLPAHHRRTGLIAQSEEFAGVVEQHLARRRQLQALPFTDEEFEQMKQHTKMGGRILEGSNSPLIQMAHRIALFHHERWDGRGYPHGLAGDAIPLEGRITAICDAFDAMCSRRVYKEAYPVDMAFGVIESELGKHFDPHLGRLFIEHRAEVLEIKTAMHA